MTDSVAATILEQLGGSKFTAMTGSSHYVSDGNTLRMNLARNRSKANRLYITLDESTDTYSMRFFQYRPGGLRVRNGEAFFVEDKITEVKQVDGVYADMLCEIFTSVTGMATSL